MIAGGVAAILGDDAARVSAAFRGDIGMVVAVCAHTHPEWITRLAARAGSTVPEQ